MTVKFESLAVDLDKEREGDWIDYPDWDGVAFKVKSTQAPAFRTAYEHMLQKMARRYQGKPVPPDDSRQAIGDIYHKHILLDWRGLDQPYSPQNAIDALTDPRFRKVFAAVDWCAQRVGDAEIEFVADAAKNSEPPSDTA